MKVRSRSRCHSHRNALLAVFALGGSVLPSAAASTIDYDLKHLLGANGFRFYATSNATIGKSVTSIGDVNGDGFDDFAIGGESIGNAESYVYLVYGKANLGSSGNLDFAAFTSANGLRISSSLNDQMGESIAGLGDVNGDGFADFVIGAPRSDLPGKTDAGRAYVIFGAASFGASATTTIGSLLASHGFTIRGANTDDFLGQSVGGGGDVNGDGFDDIVVGVPNADPNGKSQAGVAHVVFGGTGFALNSVLDSATFNAANSITILGASATDILGSAVAIAGDVNADGLDDVLIGAPGSNGTGKAGLAYVVFGAATGAIIDTTSPMTGAGFSIGGALGGDALGARVAGLGDFNGDTISDLAVSMPGNDSPLNNCGMIGVLYGKPNLGATGFLFIQNMQGTSGVRIKGFAAEYGLGSTLAGPGDVDGDGFADLLSSSENADPAGVINVGQSYLVRGGASIGGGGDFSAGDLDGTTNGVKFAGITPNDAAGRSVSGAGDVDGDGRPDLLIGTVNAKNTPGGHTGEVYVIKSLVPAPLSVDRHELSAATGGVQKMAITAGAEHAGRYYYILGSVSGTGAGVPFGGVTMPLIPDFYFNLLLNLPNAIVVNSLAVLDAEGRGEAALGIPPGLPPELSNLTIYHAYFVYDVPTAKVKMASNAVSLRIKP